MAEENGLEKKRRGCKSKYREKFNLLVKEICAETGATDRQLCNILGKLIQNKPLAENTLVNWRKEFPDFNGAIIEGRDAFNSGDVEKALLKSAKGFHFTEVTKEPSIVRIQSKTPEILDKKFHATKRVRKFIPPNPKSIEYFLNNRSHERWKSRQIHEISGKDGKPLTVTHEARLNAIMPEVREIEAEELKNAEKTAEVQ